MLEHDDEASVGCWITSTAHSLRRSLSTELARANITLRQWEVLASIAFDDDRIGVYMTKQAEWFLDEYVGFAGGKVG